MYIWVRIATVPHYLSKHFQVSLVLLCLFLVYSFLYFICIMFLSHILQVGFNAKSYEIFFSSAGMADESPILIGIIDIWTQIFKDRIFCKRKCEVSFHFNKFGYKLIKRSSSRVCDVKWYSTRVPLVMSHIYLLLLYY